MGRHLLRRPRDRGAAAVEFALVMPALVMIMFAIMEFGYAFFVQSSLAAAARVGDRNYAINWGTVGYSSSTATDLARSNTPDPSKVVSSTITTTCSNPGDQSTLTLTYQYHSLTGLLDGILGSDITMTGKASMACGG